MREMISSQTNPFRENQDTGSFSEVILFVDNREKRN